MNAAPTGTITFLFTDIEGSTTRWERQPEMMQRALARHDDLVRQTITAHGGWVFKTVGDAFYAAFVTASDALHAALATQRALHAEDWGDLAPLRVRMALHTGAVEIRDGDYFGPPLNRVARLLSAGHGAQTLLSLATQELVRDDLPPNTTLRALGERRLKDLIRPEHVFQLVVPDLPSDFPPLRTLDARPTNLPAQPTPLIGREREIGTVATLLRRAAVRLVTLTGPGGTGKTRLSVQVAAELVDEYADGVFFVNLAPISDATLVTSTIAQTLGVTEIGGQPIDDTLTSYLRPKHLLLVLDNFEQLLHAAPLVADLLADVPKLKIIVTSRAVLHLRGEHEFLVPPLALPDSKRLPPLERLTQYEAVRLFIERAQAVKPDFHVTNTTAPVVAEICVRLDGLPLAIELAAARIKLLSADALLQRLSNRLKLLTGGARDLPTRQQTLRNAIEWSYSLLNSAEQTLFARLAVFIGGRTLEAVEAVCNAEGDLALDPFDGVASLLDKSLLRQEDGPGDEPRFIMLETIHEYAREHLDASGEAETLRRRHGEYFLALAEHADIELTGPQQRLWLDRLEVEHDNLRAALRWALDRMPETALRIGGALRRFWEVRGYLSEGRRGLEAALAGSSGLPASLRAQALFVAGGLANRQSDYVVARLHFEQSLALYQALENKQGIAKALTGLGLIAWNQGDYAVARALLEQSLAIKRDVGDTFSIAASLTNLGLVAWSQGDYAASFTFHEESLVIDKALGGTWEIADSLGNLGRVALAQNQYKRASALIEEALSLQRALGGKQGVALSLNNLGIAVLHQGEPERAKALHEEALALRRDVGDKMGIADSLGNLGRTAAWLGHYEEAHVLFDQDLALRHELEDKSGLASSLNHLGLVTLYQGDHDRATVLCEEGLTLRRDIGDKQGIGASLLHLGLIALHRNDSAQATEFFKQSLVLCQELENQGNVVKNLEGLAGVAGTQTQAERAARLWGAAEALRKGIGAPLSLANRTYYERNVAAARTRLDEAAWETAWNEGRAMSLEQAIAYALQDIPT